MTADQSPTSSTVASELTDAVRQLWAATSWAAALYNHNHTRILMDSISETVLPPRTCALAMNATACTQCTVGMYTSQPDIEGVLYELLATVGKLFGILTADILCRSLYLCCVCWC